MTTAETAYVAGLLEGEGCFDFNRLPQYPRVRVEMSDADVIERLQALVGGRVTVPAQRQAHHRSTKLLTINGAAARDLMRAVRPWMGRRRRSRIETLLA